MVCSNAVFPYDNEDIVRRMVEAQGLTVTESNDLFVEEGKLLKMEVPSELVPYCSKCGKPMTVNLRSDSTFAEDKGWFAAHNCYEDFIRRHKNLHILFLELGVGANTPAIIKYPAWKMTAQNSKATYACINLGEVGTPTKIKDRSICINAHIGEVLKMMETDDFKKIKILMF